MVTPDPNENETSNPDETVDQVAREPKSQDASGRQEDIVSKADDGGSKVTEDAAGEISMAGSLSGRTAAESQIVAEAGSVVVTTRSEQYSDPETAAEHSRPTVDEINAGVLADSRRHTRRSFVVAATVAAAGYSVYRWLDNLPGEDMQPEGYRKAFETNAALSRNLFDERALTPTYPLSKAENLRVNGVYGLKKMLDPASYRLQVVGSVASSSHSRYSPDVTAWEYLYVDEKTMESEGHDTKTPPPSARTSEKMPPAPMVEQEKQNESRSGRMPRGKEEAGQSRSTLKEGTSGLLLTMEDVLKLPRHELVTQFKCIEGWSQIVQWAGIRMVDFLEAYPPALVDGKEPEYVYMETPDGDFYNGYDLDICRHPQTLLVTEMMGAPLTQYHGAPLRLHMPTKYGYKQIKRIGLISYTNSKPDDYWTKLGYDWYGGL